MTDQNNAAQPLLTDLELIDLGAKHGRPSVALLPMWRAVEAAVLSKLRAEGVQAGDERAAFEEWCRGKYALGSLAADNRWEAWQARAALASAPVGRESVCKGSMALGSGCGSCERCKAELHAASAPAVREAQPDKDGAVCSCPTGDGSLRWPCAVHRDAEGHR